MLVVAVAICFGCTSTPPASPPPQVAMGSLSDEEIQALASGAVPHSAESVYVFESGTDSKLSQNLITAKFSFRSGYLSNPGGELTIVEHRDGKPLDTRDKLDVGKLARQVGGKILVAGKPIYRLGPDGATPIVMKRDLIYSKTEDAKVVPMDADISFPDNKAAKEAARYVDPKVYKAEVKGSKLIITFKAQVGASTDLSIEFQRLAERFGGELRSIGYTTELRNPH